MISRLDLQGHHVTPGSWIPSYLAYLTTLQRRWAVRVLSASVHPLQQNPEGNQTTVKAQEDEVSLDKSRMSLW